MKRILKWFRKYLNFGIRCDHTEDNHIVCKSGMNIISIIRFHNSMWIKMPSFLRKYTSKKQNKNIFKFNPSAKLGINDNIKT